MQRAILAAVICFVVGQSDAVAWTHGSAAVSFTPAWQAAEIGGGGLMNNAQLSPSDGTIVASANTYGAYLYKRAGLAPEQITEAGVRIMPRHAGNSYSLKHRRR